jgi:hypothetical protein
MDGWMDARCPEPECTYLRREALKVARSQSTDAYLEVNEPDLGAKRGERTG